MRLALAVVLLGAVGRPAAGAGAGESPASRAGKPPGGGAAASHVELKVSPVVDLFFHVRTLVSEERPVPAELEPVAAAVRVFAERLGDNALAWGPVETRLAGCDTAAEAAARLAELPWVGSGPSPGEALGRALVAVEPHFLTELWPEHRDRIETARAPLEARWRPAESRLLAYHLRSLGMVDPGIEVPVYLTVEQPWPGAVTHRIEDGKGVSFVGVTGLPGTLLDETVLHESTHAFDLASYRVTDQATDRPSGPGRAERPTVLAEMRAELEAVGITRGDRVLRDLPHTVMFVQSAESVRRHLDPWHEAYGDASEYYQRVPWADDLVRPVWTAHLDGALDRREAVCRMVEIVAAAVQGPRAGD